MSTPSMEPSNVGAGFNVVVVIGVVDVLAVIGAVVVVGAGIVVEMIDVAVEDSLTGEEQPTTSTSRTPQPGLDVASANHKAEEESSGGGPNE